MMLPGPLIALGLLLASPDEPEAAATRPVLTIRAVHPDRQLEALLKLFEGARASSPAAALAGWKRAAADPKRWGKTAEAIIAAGNPAMVAELRSLDAAVIGLRRDPGQNRWLWRATLPHDDGTIGAVVATTLLSGGRSGPALPGTIGDSPVFYLTSGPAPLLTRVGSTLVLSNDPTQLGQAVRAALRPSWPGAGEPGWLFSVELPLLDQQWPTLTGRRVETILRASNLQFLDGRIRIEGSTLVADWLKGGGIGAPRLPSIDPDWAAIVPARGALAGWAFRVDPRPEVWTGFFDLVDRIERLDLERANVAPSRFRLALAARALGVRLEADVFPHMVGVSGWVGPKGDDLAGQGVVALHLDEGAAHQVVAGVRAARQIRTPVVAQPEIEALVDLGRVAGRPIQLHRLGGSVYLVWGDGAWAASLDARDHPERSARSYLTTSRLGVVPARAGALWLDQTLRGRPDAAELAASLADGPPLRWAGGINNPNAAFVPTDEIWLDGLNGTVRRFLDRLPFDPPPDR